MNDGGVPGRYVATYLELRKKPSPRSAGTCQHERPARAILGIAAKIGTQVRYFQFGAAYPQSTRTLRHASKVSVQPARALSVLQAFYGRGVSALRCSCRITLCFLSTDPDAGGARQRQGYGL